LAINLRKIDHNKQPKWSKRVEEATEETTERQRIK